MPGDPLRAKYIAETYLEAPVCFNTVRNMLGYTGTYHGQEISVMGAGMGMPSMGIYSYELFHFYDVDEIIRIGSAGALQDHVNVRDVAVSYTHLVNPSLHVGICGEHGGDPSSVEFCHKIGLNYVSCSPFRVPIARLAAAQAAIAEKNA